MRDILKELIGSVGFMFSALIVLLICPIGLINLFGMLSDPGSFVIILLFLLLLIPFVLAQKPCQKSGQVITTSDIPQHKRSKFTSAELEEMQQEKKQLHILNLPFHYDLFSIYNSGHQRTETGSSVKKLTETLSQNIISRFRNEYPLYEYFKYNFISSENIPYDYHVPINLFSDIVKNMMQKHRCNREYLETHYAEELQEIRWKITYHVLCSIYSSKFSVAKIQLKEDMSGYILTYPFGLPPLEYDFESDEEVEKEFVAATVDRLEECKAIARGMSASERQKVCKELDLFNLTRYYFRQPQKGRTENVD